MLALLLLKKIARSSIVQSAVGLICSGSIFLPSTELRRFLERSRQARLPGAMVAGVAKKISHAQRMRQKGAALDDFVKLGDGLREPCRVGEAAFSLNPEKLGARRLFELQAALFSVVSYHMCNFN